MLKWKTDSSPKVFAKTIAHKIPGYLRTELTTAPLNYKDNVKIQEQALNAMLSVEKSPVDKQVVRNFQSAIAEAYVKDLKKRDKQGYTTMPWVSIDHAQNKQFDPEQDTLDDLVIDQKEQPHLFDTIAKINKIISKISNKRRGSKKKAKPEPVERPPRMKLFDLKVAMHEFLYEATGHKEKKGATIYEKQTVDFTKQYRKEIVDAGMRQDIFGLKKDLITMAFAIESFLQLIDERYPPEHEQYYGSKTSK